MSMNEQRGFTLIELLVAMGAAAVLFPLLVSTIYQVTKGTDHVNSSTVALADIDNVSTWIHRDLSVAQKVLDPLTLTLLVECGTGNQPSVRVEWVDVTNWGAADPDHFAEYSIEPGTTRLRRDYDGNVGIVGRHVTSLSFCRNTNGVVDMNIVSSGGGITPITKTLFFYVSPRS